MRLSKSPRAILALVMALSLILTYMPITVYSSEEGLGKTTKDNELLFGVGDEVVFNMQIDNPDLVQTNTYDSIFDTFINDARGVTIYKSYDATYGDDELLTNYNIIGPGYNVIQFRWPGNELVLGPGESSFRTVHYTIQESDYCKDLNNRLEMSGINTAGNAFGGWTVKRIHVVGVRINITPAEATNKVGDTHEFVAKVEVNWAGAAGHSKSGNVGVWENAPDGTEVAFNIVDGPGAFDEAYDIPDDGIVAVAGGNGEARINLISDEVGTTEVGAATEYTFDAAAEDPASPPYTAYASTNGLLGSGENVLKHWVDAYITIEPDGTNVINDKHTFNATVMVYDGSGYVSVPDGTEVTFAIESGPGSFVDDTYGIPNDGVVAVSGGVATIGLTSPVIGVTEVSATAEITDPVNLAVTTDGTGQNSDNALKTWIKPDIQLVKTVDFDGDTVFTDIESNIPGATADYKYEVTLGPDSVPLTNIQLVDDILGSIAGPAEGDGNIIGTLEVGETWIYYSYDNVIMQDTVNWGTVTGEDELGNEVSDTDDAAVTVEAIYGGKTPGYWKNHPEMWVDFTTGKTLENVFDVPDKLKLDNKTLMEALSFSGGKGDVGAAQNLFRAAAAAILNASHPNLNYEFELDYIVTSVNEALTQGRAAMLELAAELDRANNAEGDIDN
ncbi:MAG TPA: hypothetical protein VN549_07680 [Negativicutes bacterium]|nr:hypothetical protein [Negativicutes bacterium]